MLNPLQSKLFEMMTWLARYLDENYCCPIKSKRPEFRRYIDMSKLTGNQKWLLWVAEQFLNTIE